MTSRRFLATAVAAAAIALAACGGKSETEFVASAKALVAAKDHKAAVIELKNALQKNPKSAEARLLLGKALLELGEAANALVELQKAQELQTPDDEVLPPLVQAMLLAGEEVKVITQYGDVTLNDAEAAASLKTSLASAYAVKGDNDKAREAAENALRRKPGYAPALIVMARLRAIGGDFDSALAFVDQVLATDANNERAGILKAELLLQGKRDIDGAIATYRQVLKSHENSVLARSAIANILFQQQKFDEAKTEFALLKKASPNHPETLFMEAQLAFADKDYKRTREISEQILKGYPNNVRVLELAGAAEYRNKAYLQAEALLSKALKLAPQQLLTRLMLAQTYLRTGEPHKAIDVLQPAMEGGKANGNVLALAGEAYLQAGDARRSEEAFQRAVKASPTDARVRTSAAMAQVARGNSGAAIGELESIAAGDSGPRADLALVSARLRQGDTNGALKAIDGLEKKMPDQALPHQLRGRVLMLKSDLAGATKSFETALAKEPAYFPPVASLAAIDLAAKKPEEARKRFNAFIQAQPKSWQARLALAELEARIGAPSATVTAALREAVKTNASEPRTHLTLINQLLNAGDAKAALQAAQDATAALPNNLELMDAQGRAELAAGDTQRALSTFKKLSGLQPRSATPELRLADTYIAMKDFASAGRSLRRAGELQPNLPALQLANIRLAMLDKRPDDAVKLARDLQKRNPQDASAYAVEGEIEASRKQWDAAIAAFRNALQRTKSSDVAAKLYASLQAAGKGPEADRMAADWLKANPKDAGFQFFLGDMALSRNDLPGAEARYRAVLEAQPDNAMALNNVAWLLARQGKPGAVAMAEKANTLMPDRAPLVDTLAVALEAENQVAKAIEMQKRAITLAPNDGNMSLRLAKLYIKSGDKPRARAELEALGKLGDKFAGQAEVTSLLKSL